MSNEFDDALHTLLGRYSDTLRSLNEDLTTTREQLRRGEQPTGSTIMSTALKESYASGLALAATILGLAAPGLLEGHSLTPRTVIEAHNSLSGAASTRAAVAIALLQQEVPNPENSHIAAELVERWRREVVREDTPGGLAPLDLSWLDTSALH